MSAQFVCRLYCNDSNNNNDVDLVQLKLFSQKTRDVDRIPPISHALDVHLIRSVFQASIWTMAHWSTIPVNPIDHGWKDEDDKVPSHLGLAAPCQGCLATGCEVNVLSLPVYEVKKVHPSL